MSKLLKQILILVSLVALLILPYFVFAGPLENLKGLQSGSGYAEVGANNDVFSIIGTVIKVFLSLLGVIFIILIIYGGYTWMLASGDEQKVTKAKDTIRRAIIGLMIVVAASAFTSFVFSYV